MGNTDYPRLDENGLRYFHLNTRPLPLTQSEYNDLSESEKKNGRLYFITDAPGGGGGGNDVGLSIVDGMICTTFYVEE